MFGELGIVFITSQTNKLEFVEVQLMKIKNPMLVVTDIDKSVEFYKKAFGFHVIMDFGANKICGSGEDRSEI